MSKGRLEAFSALIAAHRQTPTLAEAVGRDTKRKVSPLLFLVAIPVALAAQGISMPIYAGVVLMWLVPDRRIERAIRQ